MAAGLMEARRRDVLLAHVSQCDTCGAVLHAVTKDFSEELNEAEAETLEALESSKPEWQRRMALQMADSAGRFHGVRKRITGRAGSAR